ncbi:MULTISPECIES: HEPN domain-containing protein [Pseudoalteromonas]|uniref:RiboL-PSP-HEPN domain-containing protein n=1 Tax=Pseudoalteromonas amylolytica TaxID=1859457 RepID=A0A1S1MY01_9GAMM|nr:MULTISPECIES: HEPN domain-containing protein [Pseudoalteromonas]OHU89186.1 hypothetical protein BFC16_05990 [Pseudoalteromonas sp. JW3]OHU92086.1 hypothetical protein BET10_07095 [Pseudoalteromonas amylolytica]
MPHTQQYLTSQELMDSLVELVEQSELRFQADDDLFGEHMNLFVRSYMVLMCAYLESYLKNLTKHYIDKVDEALVASPYPKNLFRWSVQREKYKHNNDGICDFFSLGISSDDIDKNLSANPHKTIPFFARLGIRLEAIDDFSDISDQVEAIVTKRNNIVHYNDDASDVGARDIIENVEVLKQYMRVLDSEISSSLNRLRID